MERPAPKTDLLRLWVPVFLYTVFIFWLSSAPRPIPRALRFPESDKLLHILEYLHKTLGEKFRPAPLLVQYVKVGRLGRKSGRGVFDYPEKKPAPLEPVGKS